MHFGHTPAVEQYSFSKSSFARINVCRNTNVAYLVHFFEVLSTKKENLNNYTDHVYTYTMLQTNCT